MYRILVRIASAGIVLCSMFILPVISFVDEPHDPQTQPENVVKKLAQAFFRENIMLPKEFGMSRIYRTSINCGHTFNARSEGILGMHHLSGAQICTANISYTDLFTTEGLLCSSEVAGTVRFARPLWETGLCARGPYDGVWRVTYVRAGTAISRMIPINFIHTERGWEYFPFTVFIPMPKQRLEKFRTNPTT